MGSGTSQSGHREELSRRGPGRCASELGIVWIVGQLSLPPSVVSPLSREACLRLLLPREGVRSP
jgi:hypothetical protein